jgi:hypothetical protein
MNNLECFQVKELKQKEKKELQGGFFRVEG